MHCNTPAIFKSVTRYDLFVITLVLFPPLYVTLILTPDWNWVLFSCVYTFALIFFSKRSGQCAQWIILVSSLFPFLFFHVLLLVNYTLQESRFNEAFYYHFNRAGIVGHEWKAIVFLALFCCYYALLCFFVFKLYRFQVQGKRRCYGLVICGLLALFSPQVLSFTGMYLQAHYDSPLAQYLSSLGVISNADIDSLVELAGVPLEYHATHKKNLIFIYAESLEGTFLDQELFPGQLNSLDSIQDTSIVFSNIVQTSYTGWTIAGMVSSLCGVPLQMPQDSSSHNFSLYSDFMPNTSCMSDLLSREGYEVSFLGGASLDFAGKKSFLQTHGFDVVTGKKDLLKKWTENAVDYNEWGLRDRPLFQEAMERFVDQARHNRPFAQFFLTLDTHAPGFPDPMCKERYSAIENNSMLDAVYCSTRIIKKFIQNIRTSPYSDQTVIVVMSDHLAHSNPARKYLRKKIRKLMFMINLPSGIHTIVNRPGTHYDIGPTVFGMLGFENTQAFGFGHNMLFYNSEKGSFDSRDGLLFEQLSPDLIYNIARQPQIKSLVRKKWGKDFGTISAQGIFVKESDLTVTIDGKIFSFRNPDPHKLSSPGALLFLLDRETYTIKDITSFNDYIRVPQRFSIFHWLQSRKGVYLYIGRRSSLPFLQKEGEPERNIVACIDLGRKTGSVIGIHGSLSLSADQIKKYVQQENLNQQFFSHHDVVSVGSERKKGLSLLSCLDDACQSHIEDAGHHIFKAEWGITVFQLSHSGQVEKLVHIDHCADRESFTNAPALRELVSAAKRQKQDKVILIGHNSVFCDPHENLDRWAESFGLKKLRKIQFKQPYIGIINLKDDTVEEFIGGEFVQVIL